MKIGFAMQHRFLPFGEGEGGRGLTVVAYADAVWALNSELVEESKDLFTSDITTIIVCCVALFIVR